ncbi:MAG TPA: DMT family transporter [Thermoanaerobaculia bacterium]|nr:DMT family transporter [Thermoanaerobaculia bacterium]
MRAGRVTRARVHLALFTVAFLFSANYVVSKIGMHSFAPLSFAFLRVLGAAVLLNILVPPRGFTRRDLLFIAGLSVLGVLLNQSMFLAGLALTSAHIAAIVMTTTPVFALIVAILLGLERATATKIAGIALAFAGALVVVGFEGMRGLTGSLAGTLLILGNCCAYATYLVVSKPLLERLAPARVMSAMFAFGIPLMLPMALPSLLREPWPSIPRAAWLSLALVILGPTVIAYLLNAWTLRHAESSVVAAYIYVQPVLTAVMAWLILGETIRPVVALAALMIIAGVAVAGRTPNSERATPVT